MSCRNPLAHYIDLVLLQRDISWPSRSVGSGCLNLEYAETCTTVQFNTTQTVGQLWRAEATLGHAVSELYLKCEGLVLPQSAFLQERTYELCEGHLPLDFFTDWVPLTVVFLGHVSVWSPPYLSYRQLLEWARIFHFDSLINENSDSLLLDGRVVPWIPWKTVIVQQHPADVAFELDLLEGFGSDQSMPFPLQDLSASHMRNVSLIELFVAFRLSRPRPGCEPVVKSDGLRKYSVVTFAADFTYFKTIVRNLFQVADIPWGETVVLAGVGIVAPQFGVQCGWPNHGIHAGGLGLTARQNCSACVSRPTDFPAVRNRDFVYRKPRF